MFNTITYKFRVKDSNVLNRLGKLAGSVNFVWNYVNETSAFAWKRDRRWLSGFDMCSLVAFTTKELGLHSHTIQAVAQEHAARRGKDEYLQGYDDGIAKGKRDAKFYRQGLHHGFRRGIPRL